MPSPYASLPLPTFKLSIRVLKVPPRPASTPTRTQEGAFEIEGGLHIVNLNDDPTPPFTALSYVWGVPDPRIRHSVVCGEHRIPITPNCFSALRSLSSGSEDELFIWVDAICINQDDEEEKMRQIPLMGEIYSRAAMTYVWLGDGTSGTDRAMRYLSRAGFVRCFMYSEGRLRSWPRTAVGVGVVVSMVAMFSPVGYPYPFENHKKWWRKPLSYVLRYTRYTNHATKEDIIRLLSSPWVSRLWTYQEFLLSHNPVFVCGNQQLHWMQMARAMLFLRDRMISFGSQTSRWVDIIISKHSMLPDHNAPNGEPGLVAYWEFILCISSVYWCMVSCFITALLTLFFVGIWVTYYDARLRENHGVTPQTLSVLLSFLGFILSLATILTWCLHRYRHWRANPGPRGDNFLVDLYTRNATDPKDMAYGAWAILEKKGGSMKMPTSARDTGAVYRIFTRHFIETTHSTDIVLLAAAKKYPGQPSWVPDLAARESHPWWAYLRREMSRRETRWGSNPTLTEHGTNSAKYPLAFFPSKNILRVRATWIHTIASVYAFKTTSPVYTESERHLHLHNLSLLRCLGLRFLHDHLRALTLAPLDQTSTHASTTPTNLPPYLALLRKFLDPNTNMAPRHLLHKLQTSIRTPLLPLHIHLTRSLSRSHTTTFTTKPRPHVPSRTTALSRRPTIEYAGVRIIARTGRCSEGVRARDGIIVLAGGTERGVGIVVRGVDGRDGGVAGKGVRIVGVVEYAGGNPDGGEGGEESWYDIY